MRKEKGFDELTVQELRSIFNQHQSMIKLNDVKAPADMEDGELYKIIQFSVEKALIPFRKVIAQSIDEAIAPIQEMLNKELVEKEYSIKEVAAMTGKHHKTIRNWLNSGDLEGYLLGKTWRIKHSKLEQFKNSRLENNRYDKIFKKM